MIGFVMSAGQGTPTLDLADRGMANTITVQDRGCLEGMALYQGSLITRENSSVTFSETTAKVSSLWNIGKNTAIALESSTCLRREWRRRRLFPEQPEFPVPRAR